MTASRATVPYSRSLPAVGNILSKTDAETLQDMLERGMGSNSLRAVESDMRYIGVWALAATGHALPAVPSIDLVLKFAAHHFWTDDIASIGNERGMPSDVLDAMQLYGYLRDGKPHAIATIRRRLSTWRNVCIWGDNKHPFDDKRLKKVLRLAGRSRKDKRGRHSNRAITRDVVIRMIRYTTAYCTADFDVLYDDPAERLTAFRDRALIAFAFASGGRRRSEVSDLTLDKIDDIGVVAKAKETSETAGEAETMRAMRISLGRTKTTDADDALSVYLTGDPVQWLDDWITQAKIISGPIFRSVDRWGNISKTALTPAGVNLIIKTRIEQIDENPLDFSAHGLRSGYLTTAGLDGIPLGSAMAQSGHRSSEQAMSYFNEGSRGQGKAAQILD